MHDFFKAYASASDYCDFYFLYRWASIPVPTGNDKLRTVTSREAAIGGGIYEIKYEELATCRQPFGPYKWGQMVDQNMNPVYVIDGSFPQNKSSIEEFSNNPDFTSITHVDGKIYMITHFETGMIVYLAELSQSPSGDLTVVRAEPIDASNVGGILNPCAGSVTPWNTHLGSEEGDPNAALFRVAVQDAAKSGNGFRRILRFFGTYFASDLTAKQVYNMGFNPYQYGFCWEAIVVGGHAHVSKRYAMGRVSSELAYVMPDRKTAYIADDGAYRVFLKFLATTVNDLSSGELFCAKMVQNSVRGGPVEWSKFSVQWISLGVASDSEIGNVINETTFDDIFEMNADVSSCDTTNGWKLIYAAERKECLKLKPMAEKIASRLETRRYAAMMGCTHELEKVEGITYSPMHQKLFVAYSRVLKGMLNDTNTPNDISVAPNICGCVMAMDVDEMYNAHNLYPLVCGLPVLSPDNFGNQCQLNSISGPDNVAVDDDLNQMIIAEDTSYNQNAVMWVYDFTAKTLTRVGSVPLGAEVTGTYWQKSIGGHNYLSMMTQHPELDLMCKTAVIRFGQKIRSDVDNFGIVELTPRVPYLVNDMSPSDLKESLKECLRDETLQISPMPFSIAHRGAALMFPEHTLESNQAGIAQGAGIIECDVAVTKDGELVCRHDQCDLHTTTNILATPLASKCTVPFTPATADQRAQAKCCTTDITVSEYKTLCGKMDGFNSAASTVQGYIKGTDYSYRTDLYSTCGTLLTHREHIALVQTYGRQHTPELKTYTRKVSDASSLTYNEVRSKVVQNYINAGVQPSMVWLQSFNLPDIEYWIASFPAFGQQAIYLDEDADNGPCDPAATLLCCDGTLARCSTDEKFADWVSRGVKYIGPSTQMLISIKNGSYAPSEYALAAKQAGLKIITWTLERSGRLAETNGGWYYFTSNAITKKDGDVFEMLHVLATQVGIQGIFSDWPATVTFYANCMLNPVRISCSAAAGGSCPMVSHPDEKCCVHTVKNPSSQIRANFVETSKVSSVSIWNGISDAPLLQSSKEMGSLRIVTGTGTIISNDCEVHTTQSAVPGFAAWTMQCVPGKYLSISLPNITKVPNSVKIKVCTINQSSNHFVGTLLIHNSGAV
jgi:glycerophosphoryl diester phosphodiesterase